jgi:predicted RecA/RadA family phage recombinase
MAQTAAVFVQSDGCIPYTPGSAVTAGDVIELGGRAYVTVRDIDASTLGTVCSEGIFDVPKASGAVSAGDNVYWDNNGTPNVGTALSGAATTTASGNTQLGRATADAASGATYVRVELQPGATSTSRPVFSPEAVGAAGSAQGDATAIGADTGFVHGTGADGTKGIKLPAAAAGITIIVKNSDAANAVLKVYPATGDAINALSTNGAISMAAKTSAVFVALDATTWYTIPLLPS